MGNTFKLKRGIKANLPDLETGEPALVTDEQELYIGTLGGNIKITRNNNSALHNEIQGTTRNATFNPDGTLQKLSHLNSTTSELVREDVFTYGVDIITEVRTLANGSTVTFIYHTDTLQTEVV